MRIKNMKLIIGLAVVSALASLVTTLSLYDEFRDYFDIRSATGLLETWYNIISFIFWFTVFYIIFFLLYKLDRFIYHKNKKISYSLYSLLGIFAILSTTGFLFGFGLTYRFQLETGCSEQCFCKGFVNKYNNTCIGVKSCRRLIDGCGFGLGME